MTRAAKYDVLFEPIKIGPKIMRNRFYKAPHCTGFGSEYPGAQAYFRGMAAEGGWAVVNTEGVSIHYGSDVTPMMDGQIWDDSDVRNYALMVDRAHQFGALAGIELYYGSGYGAGLRTRQVGKGASSIPGEIDPRNSVIGLSKAEIRELQNHYVVAAKRARSAGFDIINVYGGEIDSVCQQFLMPFFNKRTDEYGGTLKNRARFWLETIEQVREAVGNDCAITGRFGIDSLDQRRTGIRVEEEGVGFVELVDHLVDFHDFVMGSILGVPWGIDAASSRFQPEGWMRPWFEQVAPYAKKPIAGVGRYTNPDTMVNEIVNGPLDIISCARPSIADPFLPKKIEEGRFDDIRECIGCNYCLGRFYHASAGISCTQNATVGEEYRRGWHPEKFSQSKIKDKDVLIVGAGPAGMECARVLGERGMRRIHLVDTDKEMGGSLKWITKMPRLGEWGRVTNYRDIQIQKLKNVEFIPNTELTTEDILEYGAELVIIATGSKWVGDGMDGPTHSKIVGADANQAHCLTPEQIMVEGKSVPGDTVLIYDSDGFLAGTALAEKLAIDQKKVIYVTPHHRVGAYSGFTEEWPDLHRTMLDHGVALFTEHLVTDIKQGLITGCSVYDSKRRIEWTADSIVLVTQRQSNDQIYHELVSQPEKLEEEEIEAVYRIGDCVVPRFIGDCIFDGHRLAREIDESEPKLAKPYIREERQYGKNDEEIEIILARDWD